VIDLLVLVSLGLVLGMRHATDPDHVIAVTTILSRTRRVRDAALIGLLWGVGHGVTVLLVGGLIVVFGLVIPRRVGLTMELGVALMLVVLGWLNLRGVLTWAHAASSRHGTPHAHPHRHGDYVHTHVHGHGTASHGHGDDETPQARLDRAFSRLGLYRALRPMVVGVLHGMAGSAAVALLVLATIRDPVWAVSYLVVFGIGTIAGMMLITGALALPFARVAVGLPRLHRSIGLASGAASLVFGIVLIYHVGFLEGLFTGSSRLTPE
jgi:high-affinity nickel-transport protein